MRQLALYIFLSTCFLGMAQIVPGYRGKKGIISYKVSISPAIERPTFLNKVYNGSNYPKADESIAVPFNFTHSLVFERVMGRKFAFAFDYDFVATKDYIKFSQTVRDNFTNQDQTYYFQNAQVNVYGHYFVGSLVFYGKRSLAPFGKYFRLSVGHCEMFSAFTQDSYTTTPTNTQYPSTVYTFNTKKVYYSLPSTNIGFSFGMNRIYKNKIVVSRGISYSFLLRPDYKSNDADNAHQVMFERLRGHDLLTFYLRFGLLM